MVGPGIVRPFDTLAFTGGVLSVKTFENSDGTSFDAVRLYNPTASALVAGRPYVVTYDGDEESNPSAIAPTATAAFPQWIVIAQEAVAATSWGWFGYRGVMPVVSILGTTGVKDDHFGVTGSAPTGLTEVGTVRSISTMAVLTETANPAGNYRAILYGDAPVTIL